MKKKRIFMALTALIILMSFSIGVAAAPKLSLYFNGKKQNTEIKIINKKPYISLSNAASLFGGKVSYDKKTNSYKMTSKDYKPASNTNKSNSADISITSGPMKLTISKVTFSSSYKYEPYMPAIRAIIFDVTVSNQSSSTTNWFPEQGIFALNTGEQIDDAIFYSSRVGGTFLGHTIKKGKIVIKTESSLEAIKSMEILINGAADSNLMPIGNDVNFHLTFK
ncbi:hypothetical protein ACN6MY_00460 [Peribacillus sp. B-H-3]|uniref:hypothetical protein n=1 Tax=Peribacillus sp. B-H-3 TaxID=3400420 RepID=UPI003B02BC40